MKKNDRNRGITLIALVVTIIVLLILAGIVIAQITGNGFLDKTQKSSDETTKKQAEEEINLKITDIQVKSYAETEKLPSLQYSVTI